MRTSESNQDFRARRNLAPWHYTRRKEEIQHAMAKSSLGPILVASSTKGLVSILFGNDREQLIAALQRRFPQAQLVVGGSKAKHRAAQVALFMEKPGRRLRLPLDIRGTEFQKKVWNAVLTIPAGQVITYAEVAHKIGVPKAVRAVGNACSMNKLSVAIPCHRVVRGNGSRSEKCPWGTGQRGILIEREMSAGGSSPRKTRT